MNNHTILIAKDFSEAPAGREVKDGPFSGERFREELLYPALKKYDQVEVVLDGTLGYGSSFLEEAFGGLIRVHKLTLDALQKKLTIVSRRPLYKQRVLRYLQDAEAIRLGKR